MPFHRDLPESKEPAKAASGFASLVEAEKLLQIAFVLPSAVVIGLALGMGADHLLHQKWIVIAGIVFGCISGLYYVIQTAFASEKASRKADSAQNGSGEGTGGDQA